MLRYSISKLNCNNGRIDYRVWVWITEETTKKMEKNKSCKYPRNIPEIDEKGSRNWINSDKRAWLVHNFEPTNRLVFLEHCEEPWVCVDLDTGRTNSFFGEVILVYPKLAGPLRERVATQAQALCYLACYVHNQTMELGSIGPDYFSEGCSAKPNYCQILVPV